MTLMSQKSTLNATFVAVALTLSGCATTPHECRGDAQDQPDICNPVGSIFNKIKNKAEQLEPTA